MPSISWRWSRRRAPTASANGYGARCGLLLPDQRGTIEDVARHGHRRADAATRSSGRERSRFAALLNEVRREHSLRHLSQAHPLSLVAQMARLPGCSSFTRWFNAEFGMPPRRWRRRSRTEA